MLLAVQVTPHLRVDNCLLCSGSPRALKKCCGCLKFRKDFWQSDLSLIRRRIVLLRGLIGHLRDCIDRRGGRGGKTVVIFTHPHASSKYVLSSYSYIAT
jgi:hypothetical protein